MHSSGVFFMLVQQWICQPMEILTKEMLVSRQTDSTPFSLPNTQMFYRDFFLALEGLRLERRDSADSRLNWKWGDCKSELKLSEGIRSCWHSLESWWQWKIKYEQETTVCQETFTMQYRKRVKALKCICSNWKWKFLVAVLWVVLLIRFWRFYTTSRMDRYQRLTVGNWAGVGKS